MIISKIDNSLSFNAKIRINKNKIEVKLLKCGGTSSVSGGASTISAGMSSGSDMLVHGSENVVPYMQSSSSLFDQFSKAGHKMLDIFVKNNGHDGYDASFFSSAFSGAGSLTYSQGMNNVVKGLQKAYNNRKIPT